jgi:hypothetical protein
MGIDYLISIKKQNNYTPSYLLIMMEVLFKTLMIKLFIQKAKIVNQLLVLETNLMKLIKLNSNA